MRRSVDGGRTWSTQKTLFDFGDDVVGNPCPVIDRDTGVIWLLLTSNPGGVVEKQIMNGERGAVRTVWLSSSKDDGESWREPEDITTHVKRDEWGWYATGPGIGIQLRNGRLIVPCDHSRIEGRTLRYLTLSTVTITGHIGVSAALSLAGRMNVKWLRSPTDP